jgi:Fe2+ transport system protein FeoA
LCQASPGSEVIIRGFEGLPVAQKCFLQSYGLLPGRCVRVVAQRPVTIVQIEETELAFESQVAKTILVES